jgi:hypothetical protein
MMLSTMSRCPGCGREETVESSHPIDIVWDRCSEGGYCAWVYGATNEVVERMEVDHQGRSISHEDGPRNYCGALFACIHECPGGDEAGDRARVTPTPPFRDAAADPDFD